MDFYTQTPEVVGMIIATILLAFMAIYFFLYYAYTLIHYGVKLGITLLVGIIGMVLFGVVFYVVGVVGIGGANVVWLVLTGTAHLKGQEYFDALNVISLIGGSVGLGFGCLIGWSIAAVKQNYQLNKTSDTDNKN